MSVPAPTESAPRLIETSTADGIAQLRFNRPKQLNAINVEMAIAFRDAVQRAIEDSSVRVIVLSGNGRAFMAGGDLAYFQAAGEQAPQAAEKLIAPLHAALLLLANAPQPVVASLHGPVAGAGMSIALAADLAIAADDTVFNLAYAKVGNTPDCSGSWSLPRLVGLRKAMEIALLAENLSAAEALRLGLVNRIVPAADLSHETEKLVATLSRSAPLAMAGTKRLLRSAIDSSLSNHLDAEAQSFAAITGSMDFREALSAFFEKRPARFLGR